MLFFDQMCREADIHVKPDARRDAFEQLEIMYADLDAAISALAGDV